MTEVAISASVFCLIPPDLAEELLDPLREHFADDPAVDVIVERRLRPRRSGVDRRLFNVAPADLVQKRSGAERRRRADRRAPQIPRHLDLPEAARAHGERIRFAQRLPPVHGGSVQELSLHELILRIQHGDAEAPTEFYWRMFERVYSRLRTLMGRYSRPDEHMAQTFGVLLDRIDEWMPGAERSFEDWLYTVVDAHAATLPREPEPDDAVARYLAG
jgi:hypothetical protein